MGEKMTRMQLKALVKECLIEILQEGLGGAAVPSAHAVNLPVSESRRQNVNAQRARQNQRVSPLDLPAYPNQSMSRRPAPSIVEAIKKEARGNSVMADILADTAMTTLPKMLSSSDPLSEGMSSSGGSSKITQQEQFNGTPEQVFGEEVASKWANLAFMDAPLKK
jgi:uncharacterized lipoprotein YmbA